MKKALLGVLLALLLVAALEPHIRRELVDAATGLLTRTQERETPPEETAFVRELGSVPPTDMLNVTLYFRFADTEVLGAQRAQLDLRREETVATRIVQRLIDGPDIAHEHLSGVFPQGTRVISVTGEATTVFVTLSTAFLGKPDGAPEDWEDLTAWQEEAALRRRLAVQSLALALTEDGRFQRVQVYVADSDNEIPQRIAMAWLDTGVTDPELVLAACPRDERVLLTPERALTLAMEAWRTQDWAALYPLMADTADDPLPTLTVFETEMADLGVSLLTYSVSTGTVSLDGQSATLLLSAEIRAREGGDAQITRESVPLSRVQDNWVLSLSTLRSLMVRD